MKHFIPKKPDKEVISIRIDSEVLKKIDRKSAQVDISRNEFINQCIAFALENIEEKEK